MADQVIEMLELTFGIDEPLRGSAANEKPARLFAQLINDGQDPHGVLLDRAMAPDHRRPIHGLNSGSVDPVDPLSGVVGPVIISGPFSE